MELIALALVTLTMLGIGLMANDSGEVRSAGHTTARGVEL